MSLDDAREELSKARTALGRALVNAQERAELGDISSVPQWRVEAAERRVKAAEEALLAAEREDNAIRIDRLRMWRDEDR